MPDELKLPFEKLYSLKEAAEKFLPASFTAKALRTEIGKGRLSYCRIAGKICVTERDIADMIERCKDPRPTIKR